MLINLASIFGAKGWKALSKPEASFPSLTSRAIFNLAQEFAREQDCAVAFREIGEIWRRHLTALRRQNEAFNCSAFLEPVLDRLGWRRIPQQSMPNLATRKRPDYCLLTSDGDFTAASEADANTLFRLSATALEAKKYGHPLDQLSTNETPGWFPSRQVPGLPEPCQRRCGKALFQLGHAHQRFRMAALH